MLPPNRRSTESDTAVESRMKTEFTFTFSLKTSHGYGIFGTPPFTEFYSMKFVNKRNEKEKSSWLKSNKNNKKNIGSRKLAKIFFINIYIYIYIWKL